MDTHRIRVILFSALICVITLKQGWVLGIQFGTGYQNQAKSSLEQGQVSGGPAAHPNQNFCSVPPPPPPLARGCRGNTQGGYRSKLVPSINTPDEPTLAPAHQTNFANRCDRPTKSFSLTLA